MGSPTYISEGFFADKLSNDWSSAQTRGGSAANRVVEFTTSRRGWVSLDHSLGPILAWFLEPLPFGSRNRADIQLADISEEELIYEAEVSSEQSAHLRPGLAKRFGRWRCERTLLEIFESEPIADYVYSWLLSDLWRTRWHL